MINRRIERGNILDLPRISETKEQWFKRGLKSQWKEVKAVIS